MFKHFSIRRCINNSIVEEDEIDRLICEKFNLEFSEDHYGLFSFKENEKFGPGQESISWVGLLDSIIYHSYIGFGKKNKYEIEAALAWVRQGVRFPDSTVDILSNLLEFLSEEGFYVFVYGYRSEDDDESVFKNSECHKMYRNESGVFECDDKGKLLRFFPAIHNIIEESVAYSKNEFQSGYYSPCVDSFVVPKGVSSIVNECLRNGYIRKHFILPDTLISIGGNEFAYSSLPDIDIPDNVTCIGPYAFSFSTIKSIRFHRNISCEYRDQFMGASINCLLLPHELESQIKTGNHDFYSNLFIRSRIGKVEFY